MGVCFCVACLPVWLKHPHHLAPASAAATESCLERCLRTDDCTAVDVVRGEHADDDDDDDDDEMSLHCQFQHSHQPVTKLRPLTTRYQLLDRCYTGSYISIAAYYVDYL